VTSLVGIGGYATSGKNEAANALIAAGWRQDAFANRMRTALLALDPILQTEGHVPWSEHWDDVTVRVSDAVREMGWDRAKREYPEVRELLQRFGTEMGRNLFGENFWVDLLFKEYEIPGVRYDDLIGLVVTDVRYPNEIRAIRGRGGKLIWIDRPGVGPVNAHASENAVGPNDFDVTILNNRGIEELHKTVLDVVEGRTFTP
jgi:hypothetical protein